MKIFAGSLAVFVLFLALAVTGPALAGDERKSSLHHRGSVFFHHPGFSVHHGLRHSGIQFGYHAGHLAGRIARDPLGRYSRYAPYAGFGYGNSYGGYYGGYYGGGYGDHRDLASAPDPRRAPNYSPGPRYSAEPYASRRSTSFNGGGGSVGYPSRPMGAVNNGEESEYTGPVDENHVPDAAYADGATPLLDGCERVSKWGRDDQGRRARIGGTLCYDEYGEGYIVEGSRFVIGYQ